GHLYTLIPHLCTFLVDGDGNVDGRLVEGIATNGDLQLPLSGNGHRDRSASITPRTVLLEGNGQRSEMAGGQQEGHPDLLWRVRPSRAAGDRHTNLVGSEHGGRHRDADLATPTGTAGVERDGRADRRSESLPRGSGVDQYGGDGKHRQDDHRLGGDGPAQPPQRYCRMP